MISYMFVFLLCVAAVALLIKLVHEIDGNEKENITDRHMLKVNKDHRNI